MPLIWSKYVDTKTRRFGIERFTACIWLWFGKYVIRIGIPWGHSFRYAWRPFFSAFRAFK